MRYRVSWEKNCKTHHLLTGETVPGEALRFAWALFAETNPSDIWIETEGGRRVAGYTDIIEEGPLYSACPTSGHAQAGAGLSTAAEASSY